ncbi:hypothetical protein DFH09DRAFT_1308417 [Mycena vulgaris]|nr:hypothetical protein DFH09DRAFT_1308417 [Mycena vulgaris]
MLFTNLPCTRFIAYRIISVCRPVSNLVSDGSARSDGATKKIVSVGIGSVHLFNRPACPNFQWWNDSNNINGNNLTSFARQLHPNQLFLIRVAPGTSYGGGDDGRGGINRDVKDFQTLEEPPPLPVRDDERFFRSDWRPGGDAECSVQDDESHIVSYPQASLD